MLVFSLDIKEMSDVDLIFMSDADGLKLQTILGIPRLDYLVFEVYQLPEMRLVAVDQIPSDADLNRAASYMRGNTNTTVQTAQYLSGILKQLVTLLDWAIKREKSVVMRRING